MSITNLTRKRKDFVDISLSFEPNPITKDITVLKNDRSINNSIKNLILIAPNEVPFRWDVGSNVNTYLFELGDDSTGLLLEREISRTIEYKEPRVEVISVDVEYRPDNNEFNATVVYKIIGYNEIITVRQILKPSNWLINN